MILTPMESYPSSYPKTGGQARQGRRRSRPLMGRFRPPARCLLVRKEDVFVSRPPLSSSSNEFEGMAISTSRFMVSLPGEQAKSSTRSGDRGECLRRRGAGRTTWSSSAIRAPRRTSTRLGCYLDLQHWAASSPLTKEQREKWRPGGGLHGRDAIGPYMRTLIDFHRDTMGVAIK